MFGPTHGKPLALVFLLGVVTVGAGRGIGAQTTAASNSASNPSQPGTQKIHYHISLSKRDTSGTYFWHGRVDGAVAGEARMELRFPDMRPPIPGTLPLETHWIVSASRASESFEAKLKGTIDLASGKTHLVGTIVGAPGALSGRVVETNSQVFHRAPNGTLSDSDGTITISPPPT